jgi:hypothetical protein
VDENILLKYINNVKWSGWKWTVKITRRHQYVQDQHTRQALNLGYYGERSPVFLQGQLERLPRLPWTEAIMLGWNLSQHTTVPFQQFSLLLLSPLFLLFIYSFSDFHT